MGRIPDLVYSYRMHRFTRSLCVLALPLLVAPVAACSSENVAPAPEWPAPVPLPPLASAPLTTDRTIVPTHSVQSTPTSQNPSVPADIAALLGEGYGDTTDGPGEPVEPLTLNGSTPPPAGAGAKLLVRFVHLADI